MTERSLADEWEARAGAWERWTRTPGHDHYFHRYNWPSFLELVPGPGRATLDLGCGEGRVGVALRQLGHRVTGVDISPSLAQLASETGGYEDVVVANASTLPFADGAFDLVVAFMSLQDMDDAAGALAGLRVRLSRADAWPLRSCTRSRQHISVVKPASNAGISTNSGRLTLSSGMGSRSPSIKFIARCRVGLSCCATPGSSSRTFASHAPVRMWCQKSLHSQERASSPRSCMSAASGLADLR